MTSERGSVSLMLIGFFIVLAMLSAVVVDASAAYLRRQSLNSLADGAALAAAEGVQGESVYTEGLGETAAVDPAVATEYVSAYLERTGAFAEYPGLQWQVRAVGDGISVSLSMPLDLPLVPPGWFEESEVTGGSTVVVLVG